MGLAREQLGLTARGGVREEAFQRSEDVARQLSVLVRAVVPAALHALYRPRRYELRGQPSAEWSDISAVQLIVLRLGDDGLDGSKCGKSI